VIGVSQSAENRFRVEVLVCRNCESQNSQLRVAIYRSSHPNSPFSKSIDRNPLPPQAYFLYFQDAHFRFMNIYLRRQVLSASDRGWTSRTHSAIRPACSGRWARNHERTDWISYCGPSDCSPASPGYSADLPLYSQSSGSTESWPMLRCGERGKSESALHSERFGVASLRWSCAKSSFSSGLACSETFAGSGPPNLVRSHLLGLGPRDPLTFIGSAIVLTFAAGLTRLPQAVSIRQPHSGMNDSVRHVCCPFRASVSKCCQRGSGRTVGHSEV